MEEKEKVTEIMKLVCKLRPSIQTLSQVIANCLFIIDLKSLNCNPQEVNVNIKKINKANANDSEEFQIDVNKLLRSGGGQA